MKIKAIVPPTREQGTYTTTGNSKQDILWDYNSCRNHDGLPPIKRMPKGTKYITVKE